jgi:hypothetical protein
MNSSLKIYFAVDPAVVRNAIVDLIRRRRTRPDGGDVCRSRDPEAKGSSKGNGVALLDVESRNRTVLTVSTAPRVMA